MADFPAGTGGNAPPRSSGIDTTVANNARVWNYWLGGKDHYDVDRQVGDRVAEIFPQIVDIARADRAFLHRAVRMLAGEAGISQFLDIGTGLPTADNTHEVAGRVEPSCRVVYVDNDPVVLAHARALLTGHSHGATGYIDADVRDPETILVQAAATLDFGRPVAVMMLGVLNFVGDDDQVARILRTLLEAVPSGSYLVLTHPTLELGDPTKARELVEFWNANATPPLTPRTGTQITGMFDGLELLEPGLVPCSDWRPEPDTTTTAPEYCAVGRKP